MSIGAKDSSNRLVAGSLRNFPQDSWHSRAVSSGKANDFALGADAPPRRDLKLGIGEEGGSRPKHTRRRRWRNAGSAQWAIFGKQNWRCGMNRTREPRCPSRRSSDPTERCRSLQTAGRWPRKSAPAKECVTTHLPKRPALKMEGAQASPPMPRRRAVTKWCSASRRARRSAWRRSEREPDRNGRRCRSWW